MSRSRCRSGCSQEVASSCLLAETPDPHRDPHLRHPPAKKLHQALPPPISLRRVDPHAGAVLSASRYRRNTLSCLACHCYNQSALYRMSRLRNAEVRLVEAGSNNQQCTRKGTARCFQKGVPGPLRWYGAAQASWPMLVADKTNAFNRMRQLVVIAAKIS